MSKRGQEKDRLESIASQSSYARGVLEFTTKRGYEVLAHYVRGPNVLELGAAEGIGTAVLDSKVEHLTVVEGSAIFCESLKLRFPEVSVVESLFEDFEPSTKFDSIVCAHVLEHVEDPGELVKTMANWLAPNGRVIAAVPNALSLHRQAAVIMGLLQEETALNDTDLLQGHRRVFTPEDFQSLFIDAGFRIDLTGGYWLKPVSNAQIEASWSDEMVSAFFDLGKKFPNISAEQFLMASPCR